MVTRSYGEQREQYLKDCGYGRPFITSLLGVNCYPCSGNHKPMYAGDSCKDAIEKASNFPDDRVLWSFGCVHPTSMSSSMMPWQFYVAGVGD